jgi:DNA-binding transcriptional MerR regulator
MRMTADAAEAPMTALRSGKSQAAFRTISEVADELDVAQHVLRFWESKFPQVRPLKRGGGRRYYRPEDIELLREIRTLLYDEGYTIKGAQKLLRQRRARPPAVPGGKAVASPAPAARHAGGELPDLETAIVQDRSEPPPPAPMAPEVASPTVAPSEPEADLGGQPDDEPPAAPPASTAAAAEDLPRLRRLRATLHAVRLELNALLTAPPADGPGKS